MKMLNPFILNILAGVTLFIAYYTVFALFVAPADPFYVGYALLLGLLSLFVFVFTLNFRQKHYPSPFDNRFFDSVTLTGIFCLLWIILLVSGLW